MKYQEVLVIQMPGFLFNQKTRNVGGYRKIGLRKLTQEPRKTSEYVFQICNKDKQWKVIGRSRSSSSFRVNLLSIMDTLVEYMAVHPTAFI